MKTNNKKKVVVSVLALAMGAGLAGSISGSVAWYQYSTRTTAQLAGTSAGTTRSLQIAKAAYDSEQDSWSADGAFGYHIELDDATFRPASMYVGEDGSYNFVDHPVYKYAILPEAQTAGYKAEFSFVFKCLEDSGSGEAQIAKNVYLTALNIVPPTAGQGVKDITPAVRLLIDGKGNNDFIIAPTAGTTTTSGPLDLNDNGIDDKDGFPADDSDGNDITYRNAAGTNTAPNLGTSYSAVAPSSVVVDNTDPYNFTNKADGLIMATTATGTALSDVVTITVWIEGWQELDGDSLWDEDFINQNFKLQFEFSCEAER